MQHDGHGVVLPEAYELLAPLGSGSFGCVYRARHRRTGREVALKLATLPATDDARLSEGLLERFRRETRLCAELTHPNIASLLDAGDVDGRLYVVFALVPGVTLREVLDREGALPAGEAVHLMAQVLDAIGCAHRRGIVHRDIKPENIMITSSGLRRNAVVLDFGLAGLTSVAAGGAARLTAAEEMLGTPCYAAPEQLRGDPVTVRSDLYSWGLVLLECLTGETAVHGASAQDVVMRQLGPEPVPLPTWLRAHRLGPLLRSVTAKVAERRAESAAEVLEGLTAVAPAGLATVVEGGTAATRPEGQRRQLTVVSCRLTVSTPGTRSADAEELDGVLQDRQGELADIAGRFGGLLASTLGDRTLLVFGYPSVRENEARLAARAALEFVHTVDTVSRRLEAERGIRVDVRVGVHTGLVTVRESRGGVPTFACEMLGLTPQLATRLDEAAAPGDVLVSIDTERLLQGAIGVEPAHDDALPVPAFRLLPDAHGAPGRGTIRMLRETPLVGRAAQLEALLGGWAVVQRGRSRIALVTGEPGIGKSRLVRELRRRVAATSWLEGRCTPESQDSPLRPIGDVLHAALLDEPLEAALARHSIDPDEHVPLLGPLVGLAVGPPVHVSPDRRRELTLSALITLFLRIAEDRPLVLVMEDVHWSDPTTLDLLQLLVQEIAAPVTAEDVVARLYLVCTARPGFTPPWPLDSTVPIPLPRLEPAEVQAMVAAVGEDSALPSSLVDEVVARADGIPLFVEEVARVLAERGADGVEPRVPGTLRDLLTARLDALSRGARETAQLAAALGREFRYEILRVTAPVPEAVLREDLRELTDAGLIYHRARVRPETYLFKHALVRDGAYEMMPRGVRRRAHERIAAALETYFPDLAQDRPEMLARQLEAGGRSTDAAAYWKRSGDRTMARGAYAESIRHFQRGLALVESAPERSTLAPLEVGLLESLGTAQLSTQGYASPDVEATFARVQALCEQLGEQVPLRALHGVWGVRVSRGDRDAAIAILPGFHAIAARSGDAVSRLTVHAHTGLFAFLTGDFLRARDEFEAAVPWYDTAEYRAFLAEYGYDGGLYAFGYLAWTHWILGDETRARAVHADMAAIAARSRNPYGIAIAIDFEHTLAINACRPAEARIAAERAMAHAQTQKLHLFLAYALCAHGWAVGQEGAPQAGVDEIRQGLALFQMAGFRLTYPYHQTLLAETLLRAGAHDEGLAAVDEGLAIVADHLDASWEAELRRVRGELLQAAGRVAEAARAFEEACALARRQGARAFELRAAVGLGRLLATEGRAEAARAVVGAAVGHFGATADGPDLATARALLAAF